MEPIHEPEWKDMRSHIAALHRSALAASDPEEAVLRHLRREGDSLWLDDRAYRLDPTARLLLIAFGKASLGMARGALKAIGERWSQGLLVHPEGTDPGSHWPAMIQLLGGGHPLPTNGSLEAGERAAEMFRALRPGDIVLALVSGGGSAMLEKLPDGLTSADLGELTTALQHAGADIKELNTVRRSLSPLKGGGLARLAAPATTIALLLSDVLGDAPEAIASGPTVASPTGPGEALAVLDRYGLRDRFGSAVRIIESHANSVAPEMASIHSIVGSNRHGAVAVSEEAARHGFQSRILTTHMEGEAREVGRMIGGLAWSVRSHSIPVAPPACLVLGGETTVTVRGKGKGGRNQELALGAAVSLDGCERSVVFSFATDGIDGNSPAAGAIATGETLGRARAAGLSVAQAFEESDTFSFFGRLGDLWTTGPSGTNVNDLTVVLVYPL